MKGSEIVHRICCVECKTSNPDPCPESCLKYQQALLGKIVVPSETWDKVKSLIDKSLEGVELDVSDIPSINVPMLKDTKFLLFRKDKIDNLKEELREAVE